MAGLTVCLSTTCPKQFWYQLRYKIIQRKFDPAHFEDLQRFTFTSSALQINSQKSTILITGGASDIGLAIGQRLLALGHTVIAAGRRQDVLDSAAKANPGLKIIQADVSTDAGRIELFTKTVKQFPEINVLFNNAGVVHNELPPLKDNF
eukprot:gene23977-30263_t